MTKAQHPNSAEVRASVAAMRGAFAAQCAALTSRVTDPDATPLPAPAQGQSALDGLAQIFGLTTVERDILCLVAGAELDGPLSEAVEKRVGNTQPDLSLAMALFGQEAWDSLCPAAPLRKCRLVDLVGTGPMLRQRMCTDERILNYLMGLTYLDARLDGMMRRVPAPVRALALVHSGLALRITTAWSDTATPPPVLLLASASPVAARNVLAHALHTLDMPLFRLDAADIPTDWAQRHALVTLVDRELALSDAALLIESVSETAQAAADFADRVVGAVGIAATDPVVPERAPRMRIDIAPASITERRAAWHGAIGPKVEALGPGLDRLASQFTLDEAAIDAAVEIGMNGTPVPPDMLFPRLWQAARDQGRRRLDGLADRIVTHADWDDLVLPEAQKTVLRDLATHVREAWRVGEAWGWSDKNPRGMGAAALFAGASGTGKTFAAEVLATSLDLDLYRIDLSQVVSKYIGETEKNLSRIFAAAEDGGAILLFDEADALFGKRSEVKDSHDRYANVEVSYLLQRMEAYRGLAILTTNQKSALDTAFLRRLRYVIQFPFPDTDARAQIWARIFPDKTPLDGIDPLRLGRLNLTGGSIRSVALNACFLAAGSGGPVQTSHVMNAAQREYAKLEKPMSATEREALQ